MKKKDRMRERRHFARQNPNYPAPTCPVADAQGGIRLNAIFPSPGNGIQLRINTPGGTEMGDYALVYWGAESNLVGNLPLNPEIGYANFITVDGAMARRVTPENTRNTVQAWYVIVLSDFGGEFPSERLDVHVDFQPPGGLVRPEHQASINPSLRRIPELDQPIPQGQDLTIRIPNWDFMEAGDELHVRWGSHPIGPIPVSQVGSPVPVVVPWSIVSTVDGGRAIVDYYVVDAVGNDSRYSAGQQVMHLPAPVIPEANGQFLDGGLASARLVVPAEATLQPGDMVEGFFANQSLGTAKPATPGVAMSFTIPGSLIAPNQGNVVAGYYRIVRGGATHTSPIVEVAVIPVVAPTLPPPDIPERNGNQLDGTLTRATVRVPAAAPLRSDDRVEAFFAGKSLGSRTATPGVAMDFTIPGAEIAANQGNQVSATYVVTRAGIPYPSPAFPISVTRPEVPEWDLEYNFDSDAIRHVGPGGTIVFPASGTRVMDMYFDPEWNPPIPPGEKLGVRVYEFTPTTEFRGNVLYVGDPQGVSHNNSFFVNFAQNWDVVRFAITSVHREVTISFKDANRNVISPIFKIEGPAEKQTEVRFNDQGRRRIRHVEIRAVDVVRFDSFKFKR